MRRRLLKLGVIGAGAWAVASHLPVLARHTNVEMSIVSRRSPRALDQIKRQFGFRQASTDWRDVIDADCDIVVVASPPAFHWEHAKASLESGAHTLCEKPFTLSSDDAWDLDETARKADRELIVAFGWNYRPATVRAHELLRDLNWLGEIESVAIRMASSTRDLLDGTGWYSKAPRDVPPTSESWTNRATSGGGYGQAQLSHALGLALYLSRLRGANIYATMGRPTAREVEMHAAGTIQFVGGAVGTLSGSSWHSSGLSARSQLDVLLVGSEGHLLLDVRQNVLVAVDGRGMDRVVPLHRQAGTYDCVGPVDTLVHRAMGRDVVNRSPAELGARTVEILEGMYRSAALGSSVPIPLTSRQS